MTTQMYEALRQEFHDLREEVRSGFIALGGRVRDLEVAVARLEERNSARRDLVNPWHRALAGAVVAALVSAVIAAAVILIRKG